MALLASAFSWKRTSIGVVVKLQQWPPFLKEPRTIAKLVRNPVGMAC